MCYEYVASIPCVILTETYYTEQYQGIPNGKIQPEHFGKDASVSIEVRIITNTGKFDGPNNDTARKILSYDVLHVYNKQNTSTAYRNLKLILKNISTRGELPEEGLKFILNITNGFSVQYECGHALQTMALTATVRNCIFIRCIRCAGHRESRCDANGGIWKTHVDTSFDRFDALTDDKIEEITIPTHRVENRALLSLARIVHSVLDTDASRFEARSHSTRTRESRCVIQEHRFLLQERLDVWVNI